MIKQFNEYLSLAIGLLYQLVLVSILIALILGDGAGSAITSIYANVKDLLGVLNPAAVAVAAVLFLFWQMHKNRVA
jgi:hypothetical protein